MLVVMDHGYADLPGQAARGRRGRERGLRAGRSWMDLVPHVDREFRTLADADHRAIAGLSMGAGQATNIGLHHLDQFRWIGSLSGVMRGFDAAGGPLADAAEANRKLRLLWIGCGTGDGLYPANERVHSAWTWPASATPGSPPPARTEWQVWRKSLYAFRPPLLFRSVSGPRGRRSISAPST